jgi:hypothetical protein
MSSDPDSKEYSYCLDEVEMREGRRRALEFLLS